MVCKLVLQAYGLIVAFNSVLILITTFLSDRQQDVLPFFTFQVTCNSCLLRLKRGHCLQLHSKVMTYFCFVHKPCLRNRTRFHKLKAP